MVTADETRYALMLIAWGLFKKVVPADSFGNIVDSIDELYKANVPFAGAGLLFGYAFSRQIYCDFSAYTDIARGSVKLIDVDLIRNFNTPYFAASPTEFWHRWHISLSTWLRDYLYIPLGGLWDGAGILFILWGVWHGVMLVLFKVVPVHRFLTRRLGVIGKWLSILLTCHIVCLGWILFRGHTATIIPLLQSIPALFQPGNLILFHAFARGVIILGAVTLLADYLGYRKDGAFNDLFKTMNPYIGTALIAACYCGLMMMGKRESVQFIFFHLRNELAATKDANALQPCGPEELIDRGGDREDVAGGAQRTGVSAECRGVATDIDNYRHTRSGDLADLRGGPGMRRIQHHGGETRQLLRRQHLPREVAPRRGDAAGQAGLVDRLGQRGDGRRIALPRSHAPLARLRGGECEGQGAAAGVKFSNAGASRQMRQRVQHGIDDRALAGRSRLQEGAGRWPHRHARQHSGGRAQQADRFSVVEAGAGMRPGDARQGMGAGEGGQRGAVLQRRGRVGAQQQVGAGLEQINQHRALAAQRAAVTQQRAQPGEQGQQRRVQHQAVGEVDHRGGARAVQAQNQPPAGTAQREIQAAAFAGQTGQQGDRRRGEAGGAQGRGQQLRLPGAIGRVVPVLQSTAAAGAEMAAGRVGAVGAGGEKRVGRGVPAVTTRGNRVGGDTLPRQGQRQVERRAIRQGRDAVGLGADTRDGDVGGRGWFAGRAHGMGR